MNSTTITGNLTHDPELRRTPSGKAVATISIAETPRRRNEQTGRYEDGQTSYYTATIWGPAAENVAESLGRGHRVIVTGRLVERSFTATRGEHEGETLRRHEIVVEELGPSLRFATAKPENESGTFWGRLRRGGGQQTRQGFAMTTGAGPVSRPGAPGGPFRIQGCGTLIVPVLDHRAASHLVRDLSALPTSRRPAGLFLPQTGSGYGRVRMYQVPRRPLCRL